MTAFDRLSRMCGPQVPPELLALLAEHRAEVLNEAADKVGSRCEEYGVLGVGDLLRRMATTPASSVPVPDNTTGDEELATAKLAADASWLCPNNPLGHRWITRPFPEVTTPHCELCGRTKGGES